MKNVLIRMAQKADAAEILDIYSPYIKDTAVTFEYEVPSIDEFEKRIAEISNDYPYLVCCVGGKIAGYAYAHRERERAAYQWNAELSVYVSGAYLRMGIGRALYSGIIEILEIQNIQNIYSVITIPNNNSIKLHEYFGFKELGVHHKTGYKCGVWHDVLWMEKWIGKHEDNPKPIVSIKEVEADRITNILNKCCGMIKPF